MGWMMEVEQHAVGSVHDAYTKKTKGEQEFLSELYQCMADLSLNRKI